MRRTILFGTALIVFAILILLLPWYILPICEVTNQYVITASGAKTLMKCGWSARAEMATGVGLMVIGVVLMLMGKQKETQRSLGIIGSVLGIFTMLFPTYLIGVCATAAMLCNPGTRPAWVLVGGLALITCLVLIFTARDE